MSHNLRASWADIAQYLEAEGEPRSVIRVINLFLGQGEWVFTFTAEGDRTDLHVSVDPESVWNCGPEQAFSGIIPELLNCSEILVRQESTMYRASDIDSLRDAKNFDNLLTFDPHDDWRVGMPVFVLKGFWGQALPPALSHSDTVQAFACNNSWLGSPRFASVPRRLRWQVLAGQEVIVENSAIRSRANKAALNIPLSLGNEGEATLIVDPGSNDRVVRLSGENWCGGVERIPVLDGIARSLDRQHVDSFLLEIHAPQNFSAGALGRIAYSGALRRFVSDLCSQIDQNDELKRFARSREEEDERTGAQRLNERIASAQRASVVQYRGVEVSNVPKSEMGTIALFSRLEGMGAIPMQSFRLREFASNEGIDSLADFEVREGDVVQTLAPVEFEFTFINFERHGHSHRQVRLIICWIIGGTPRAELRPTEHPWLFTAVGPKGKTDVAVISDFPGIEAVEK